MQVEQWKDGKLLSTESVTDVEDAAAEPDDDWDDDEQARPSVPLAFSDAWTATLHVGADLFHLWQALWGEDRMGLQHGVQLPGPVMASSSHAHSLRQGVDLQ